MSKLDDMSIVSEFTNAAHGPVEDPPPSTPQLRLELRPDGAVVREVHRSVEEKKHALVSPQFREGERDKPHKRHLLHKREFLRVRGGVFDYGWEKETLEAEGAAPAECSTEEKMRKHEQRMQARRQCRSQEKEKDHERD